MLCVGRTLGLILILAVSVEAQVTWWVSPCGDDAWSGASSTCIAPDGPKASIQAAIDVAADGDTVLVLPGTYSEVIDFKGLGIALTSAGGPDATIIDGTGRSDSVVKCVSGEGTDPNRPATVLSGFTVTNGSASIEGGGMLNIGSSPMVVACTFVQNNAASRGGGMRNRDGSAPRVVDCTFRNNTSPGGGGMSNWASSPTLSRCIFEQNTTSFGGGGLRNEAGSSPVLVNCAFVDNTAKTGGGMFNLTNCSPQATNCAFTGNSATGVSSSSGGGGGGIMSEDNADPTLINCTFVGNHSTGGGPGGGLFSVDGAPVVTNCIFWGNSDVDGADESAQLYVGMGSTANVSYTTIEGCADFCADPSDHNIGDDPLLTSDLRLACGSPCIDAGNTLALPGGVYVDLVGNGRVLDGPGALGTGISAGLLGTTVDMGAFEFKLQGDVNADDVVSLTDLGILLANFGVTCP